jgi:uncharacterized OB-fold protein
MAYPFILKEYVEAVGRGRFLGLKCGDCQGITFPARSTCASCGSRNLGPVEIQGQGEIRTFTVIRVAPLGFNPPYVVAMVELDQGPWVMGNLEGLDPDRAGLDLIGRKVRLGSKALDMETYGTDECRVLTFTLT